MHDWNTDGSFDVLPASSVLLKAAGFLTELLAGEGEVTRAACCTSNLR
jgi:hypothetical protein